MSVKDNFSPIKPSLLLDFANTKVLDPRITYSRASEAEANAVLYTTDTVLDEDGNVVSETVTPNYQNIDTIGTIYERSEDPEAEPVSLLGYHVNVRVLATEDLAPLEPFSVQPTQPRRVWA